MDNVAQPHRATSAQELMRLQDASDRVDALERKLKRNGVRLGLLGAVGAMSVYAGIFLAPAGFFGLLLIPQFLVPLMKQRRRISTEREELLRQFGTPGAADPALPRVTE